MSELTRLLATPRILHHNGTDYPVGLIKLRVRAEYERRLVARIIADLGKRKNHYKRHEYLDELRTIHDKEAAGDYAFLSPAGAGSLRTPWGLKTIYALLLPDVSAELLDDIIDEHEDELVVMLDELIRDSFPRVIAKGEKDRAPCDASDEKVQLTGPSASASRS